MEQNKRLHLEGFKLFYEYHDNDTHIFWFVKYLYVMLSSVEITQEVILDGGSKVSNVGAVGSLS